jgi:DNA-binding NarL/FixJ family response regulator
MTLPVQMQSELNWSKTTFLVADTKTLFRDMVQTALMGAGAKSVKHATSVDKAIEVLTRYGQEINCVICDWDMSPVGGIELLRMIRARALPKTSPRTAVVMLTAKADAAAVKASMALDVNGFAVAPLSFEKLVKTVGNALTRTWILRQPEQYLAVPGIDTSQPVPEVKPHTARTSADTGHGLQAPAAHHAPQRVPGSPSASPGAQRSEELKNVHMCNLAEVRPGQVLARDLRDKEGHLLLSAGAVLKQTLIDRLTGVAQGHADSYHLWIGERDSHA